MYYNDDFRSSDQYRYTNRDQLPHDDYAPGPNRAPAPAPESPKKQGFFHRTAVKVTALILACAVAGGLAGWGGAAIAGSSTSRRARASPCRCRRRTWTVRPRWSLPRCTPPW